MEKLLNKHPDLESTLRIHQPKTYKVFDDKGNIQEYWEKDENGHYVDQTAREKAKEAAQHELELAQKELEKARKQMDKLVDGVANNTKWQGGGK